MTKPLNWAELIWQPVTTSSILGLSGSFKALPSAKIAPKRSHAHCLMVCCWSDQATAVFWIGKTITSVKHVQQIVEIHQKLQCLQPALVNRKGPILLHSDTGPKSHNEHFKSWRIGLWSLASSAVFTWCFAIGPTSSSISTTFFAGKMLPKPAGVRKCFPRVHKIQNHGFLCYRNKQTYSCWQKCGDCNGSYFD